MIQFLGPIVSGVRGRRTPVSVHGFGAGSLSTILAGAMLALPASAAVGSSTVLAAAFGGVVVSTSGDLVLSSTAESVDDSALIRVEAGTAVWTRFHPGHWQGVAGEVPGDIDGLARRPGVNVAGHQALAFTLQANEFGFLDGDVLGLAAGGGFEVLVFESDVANELGTPGASIDLDAIAYDDQGRLLFSLQADLAGSVLGDVQDGDILRMDTGGGVSRLFTEADVQAGVSAVTGSASAINDVLGIDVVSGELWVSVQSPSAIDGSVFSLGSSPALVLDEVDAGLDGAEIDALIWSDPLSEIGTLRFDVHASAPGNSILGQFSGGAARWPALCVRCGEHGLHQ